MLYDVIVVGAGPAGSTAARECAARGMSVVLLDKAEFPRDKPCGGAVTPRAAAMLPFDLAPVVERRVTGVEISLRQGPGFSRRSPEPIVFMTQRRLLDAFLLERALEASVVVRQRATLREVVRRPTRIAVRAGGEMLEGRALVAADGANGPTASLAGLKTPFTYGLAIEGNISPPGGVPERWRETAGLDVGALAGGYGWLFPKGDHLNVGTGGWRYLAPRLREHLDVLVRFYGYDPAALLGLRAHHLPLRHPDTPLADGNVALVGDAAGLVDPLTGEGIGGAIWSGRAVAGHLHDFLDGRVPDLGGYARQVQKELASELAVSRMLHDLFHLTPGLYVAIERRTSLPWRGMRGLLLGDRRYTDIMRRLGGLGTVMEFTSDLMRITPTLQRIAGLRDPAPPERFFRRSAQHR